MPTISERLPSTNYRERFPKDLTSNLDSSHVERPIDRITAFSFADRMGTYLWRYRAGDRDCGELVKLLASKAKTTLQIATVSLWLYLWGNQCWKCHGKKNELVGDKVITCPRCEGLGYVKLTDRQLSRMMNIGLDAVRSVWKSINKCLDILVNADRSVSVKMRLRLIEVSVE